MNYELIITEHAEKLLDSLVHYLLFELRDRQAAVRFMDGLEQLYSCLEQNPLQFPVGGDSCFFSRDYREAAVPGMRCMAVFWASSRTVTILGVFDQLENFRKQYLDG